MSALKAYLKEIIMPRSQWYQSTLIVFEVFCTSGGDSLFVDIFLRRCLSLITWLSMVYELCRGNKKTRFGAGITYSSTTAG